MDNIDYFNLCQSLNTEKKMIVKDIIMRKQKDIATLIHPFLIGSVGTSKTFIAKAIYHALARLYSNDINDDPEKPKGMIVTYTGKATYNIGGATIHSALHIPFNKSEIITLSSETLDKMCKHYSQLCVLLIDDISLVGSSFLRYIDLHLHDIMQKPTSYFRGLDTIFCGNLY